jgi:hypothetical protein
VLERLMRRSEPDRVPVLAPTASRSIQRCGEGVTSAAVTRRPSRYPFRVSGDWTMAGLPGRDESVQSLPEWDNLRLQAGDAISPQRCNG